MSIGDLPEASLLAAFLAGLLSFVSPCVLPVVPSYVTYITGLSLGDLADHARRDRVRRTILANALLFIVGFSAVFVAFGASASALGRALAASQDLLRKAGAAVIVGWGLFLMGLLKLPVLMGERRVRLRSRPAGYTGSFLVGAAFAAGWTPCIGPVLGTLLLYAGMRETLLDGVTLLACYSVGLGAPFLATALCVDRALTVFTRVRAHLRLVSVVTGAVLVMLGIVIFLNRLSSATALFERYGIGADLGVGGG